MGSACSTNTKISCESLPATIIRTDYSIAESEKQSYVAYQQESISVQPVSGKKEEKEEHHVLLLLCDMKTIQPNHIPVIQDRPRPASSSASPSSPRCVCDAFTRSSLPLLDDAGAHEVNSNNSNDSWIYEHQRMHAHSAKLKVMTIPSPPPYDPELSPFFGHSQSVPNELHSHSPGKASPGKAERWRESQSWHFWCCFCYCYCIKSKYNPIFI